MKNLGTILMKITFLFLFEQLVNKLAQPEINESQRFLEIGQFCTQYKVAPS